MSYVLGLYATSTTAVWVRRLIVAVISPGLTGCIFQPSAPPARRIAFSTSAIDAGFPPGVSTGAPLTLWIGWIVQPASAAAANATRRTFKAAVFMIFLRCRL